MLRRAKKQSNPTCVTYFYTVESESDIKAKCRSLPEVPGVYQFFDAEGGLLYVGKAKNLKNRVGSYFNKQHDSGRLRLMVKLVRDIQVLVAESELDALLLENNLIKTHQPRFNVMLRDDKTYPWICIKKEPFPRIFSTRNRIQDGSEYYGPYASVKMMRAVLDLVRQLYPLRTCKLHLKQESISEGKFNVCLEYHIGNCLGPCVGKQSEADYERMIEEARTIIKGKTGSVARLLRQQMEEYAAEFAFEQAQEVKERLEQIEKFRSKSVIVRQDMRDVDVASLRREGNTVYVNYLKVTEGAVVQGYTLEVKPKLEETDAELLVLALFELRKRFGSEAEEVLVPFDPETEIVGMKFVVPQRGERKMLLELSERNLRFYLKEKWANMALKDPEKHSQRILETLKKDLRLTELPVHMECFDNSNFQGAYPVSAMVCFRDAKPSKKDYRHFNIKTVEGPDDFASMKEAVYRRYKRLKEEEAPLPQLIVIDGGKGQLSAALEALEALDLRGKIPIIGIAKRLEEIYFPGDPLPLYLDKRSESLKVIQQMRNEAHRFGISHYRSRHKKTLSKSSLEEIEGIGSKTVTELLRHFRTVKRVREASEEELTQVVGQAKAKKIKEWALES